MVRLHDERRGAYMKTRLAVILLCILSVPRVLAQTTKSEFFKTSDGIRIHYLETGSGRPIVFIPGWTMPAWIWQKQIDEFSKKYHVIAVDPRSQGESDKPPYGHLPETRARDYKELVDHLGLKQPVMVGWSMGCGELVKQADAFVRGMYKKAQTEDYYKRVIDASMQVPPDTAVALIYNGFAVKDFPTGFAKMNRPVLFAYQPDTQQSADFVKAKLGDKVRLERFDGDGHALFVDDPEKFNRVLEEFLQNLPK